MTEKMNASQRRAYRNVIDYITMGGHYEIKEATINAYDFCSDVLVQVETGLPNDEGTMAAVICRDTYTFFIGARGGLYDYTSGTNRVYFKYYEVGKYCRARY